MDEILKRIALAMAVSVDDARYIFDSVRPLNAVELVRSLVLDRATEQAVLEAARTDPHWWRPKKERWEL
jgi:hypothetical protein